jgi:type VI secretion system protein ImpK
MHLVDCFTSLICFTLQDGSVMKDQGFGSDDTIHDHFFELVGQARRECVANGFDEQQCEEGLFAVIAWIDEYRLCEQARENNTWLHNELQRTLFNTSSAGDEFYDHFDNIPSDDQELKAVYIHCLALGFRGRLFDDPDGFADFCQKKLGCRAGEIGGDLPQPLFPEGYFPESGSGLLKKKHFLPSSFTVLVFLLSLVGAGAVYWVCRIALGQLYASLPMG